MYVRETANILRIFEFRKVTGRKTILSYRLSTSGLYFFYENQLSFTKS